MPPPMCVAEVRRVTGGAAPTWWWTVWARRAGDDSLRASRRGGRLVTCGATTGPMVALDSGKLFWHQWSLLGSTLGSRREYAEIVGAGRSGASSGRWWTGWCRSSGAPRRTRRLQRGEQTGKLVIEVAP